VLGRNWVLSRTLPNHGAETPAEPREIHIVVRFTTHGGGSTAGKIVQEVGVDAMRVASSRMQKKEKNPD
jgi:hypothetical protein